MNINIFIINILTKNIMFFYYLTKIIQNKKYKIISIHEMNVLLFIYKKYVF